jgi:hypothetical protein
MRLSKDYDQFEAMLDQIHPRVGEVPLLTYSRPELEEAEMGI